MSVHVANNYNWILACRSLQARTLNKHWNLGADWTLFELQKSPVSHQNKNLSGHHKHSFQ